MNNIKVEMIDKEQKMIMTCGFIWVGFQILYILPGNLLYHFGFLELNLPSYYVYNAMPVIIASVISVILGLLVALRASLFSFIIYSVWYLIEVYTKFFDGTLIGIGFLIHLLIIISIIRSYYCFFKILKLKYYNKAT